MLCCGELKLASLAAILILGLESLLLSFRYLLKPGSSSSPPDYPSVMKTPFLLVDRTVVKSPLNCLPYDFKLLCAPKNLLEFGLFSSGFSFSPFKIEMILS